jgi:enoyl-CoA hydratase/carnithine racemase
MSGSVLLREVTTIDVAKELTMTARMFDGTQAKSYGIVSHVVDDPFEGALSLAKEISTRSPDCVSAAKQLFNNSWNIDEQAALEMETILQKDLLVPPLKNTMAAASIGLNFPVQLSFKNRQSSWKGSKE